MRRVSPLLPGALVLLSLFACSSGTTQTGGSSTGNHRTGSDASTEAPFGAACLVDPCATGLTCFSPDGTEIPDGYCSIPCGDGTVCPSASTCVEALPGEQLCVSTCTETPDCTRADYACDPTCGVCVPTKAVGLVSCGASSMGSGGHAADGGVCGALPAIDAGLLTWSASVELSASAATASEAQGVLAYTSAAGFVSAFPVVPADAGSQTPANWIGTSQGSSNGTASAGPFSAAALVSPSDQYAQDPSLATDSTGLIYLAFTGNSETSTGATGELWVATSEDGLSWSAPANALGAGDIAPGGSLLAGGGIDKPVIAVDPASDQPVVVFSDFSSLWPGQDDRIKLIALLPDGGFLPSVDLDDGSRSAFRDLPALTFDANGDGYAAWLEATNDPSGDTVIEDQATGTAVGGSTDNAIYFATLPLTSLGYTPPAAQTVPSVAGEQVVVDRPAVAVAADGTSVYVVYVVGNANATDIEVAVSEDHGGTWTTHTIVNDDPHCATHFHPAAVLDAAKRLWVTWVDNRDGAGHVFYALSTDEGHSFTAAARLSDVAFSFTTLYGVPAWMGGGQSLYATATELWSVWSGATGGSTEEAPAHVYFQRAALP